MDKRLITLGIIMLSFMFAALSMSADDPFTGTWRQVNAKTESQNQGQLILTPNGDGITIQQDGQTMIARYGKDSTLQRVDASIPVTINIVRIDSHTLKSTFALDGKIIANETATVSADGKRYSRVQEQVGIEGKTTIEFERVGPISSGDAFLGTWQRIPRPTTAGPLTLTFIVDAETFDWSQRDRHMATAKFDGKDYKIENSNNTVQVKRIDDHTIEIVQKLADIPVATIVFQVRSNSLTRSTKVAGAQGQSNIQEFERIK